MNTGSLDNLGKMYYWYVCSNPQDTVIQHDEMEYLSGFYVSGDIELNWELIWKGFLTSLKAVSDSGSGSTWKGSSIVLSSSYPGQPGYKNYL